MVALVGVATEGNSIRAVLEVNVLNYPFSCYFLIQCLIIRVLQERLEAANAIKKQMWAEAQIDKRRSKEEFGSKMQYNSYTSLKVDVIPEHNATETTPSPVRNFDIDNDGNVGAVNNSEILNHHDSFQRHLGSPNKLSRSLSRIASNTWASTSKETRGGRRRRASRGREGRRIPAVKRSWRSR